MFKKEMKIKQDEGMIADISSYYCNKVISSTYKNPSS